MHASSRRRLGSHGAGDVTWRQSRPASRGGIWHPRYEARIRLRSRGLSFSTLPYTVTRTRWGDCPRRHPGWGEANQATTRRHNGVARVSAQACMYVNADFRARPERSLPPRSLVGARVRCENVIDPTLWRQSGTKRSAQRGKGVEFAACKASPGFRAQASIRLSLAVIGLDDTSQRSRRAPGPCHGRHPVGNRAFRSHCLVAERRPSGGASESDTSLNPARSCKCRRRVRGEQPRSRFSRPPPPPPPFPHYCSAVSCDARLQNLRSLPGQGP